MKKIVSIFGLTLWGLSGCFSSTPKDEHFYNLVGPENALERNWGPRLLVSTFTAAAGYETPRIAYRLSEHELRYYGYHQWVSEPARMLTEMTIRHLRASHHFSDVGYSDKIRDPDLILEGNVDAIEEVDRNNSWSARLAITFVVRKGASEKIILRHAFDKNYTCSKRSTDEVANGISSILEKEMKNLSNRIIKLYKKLNANRT